MERSGSLAFRLTGSPDAYEREEREAEQSVNFVTCHDGSTLNDLVSFNNKHNEANGEGNRDGADHNGSWNCGTEGPTADPEVERLRRRQVKNFLTLTLLAIGTPMLLMGDEVRRSQGGNNNAYCQKTEISWFDWALVEKHADLFRFVKELDRLRSLALAPGGSPSAANPRAGTQVGARRPVQRRLGVPAPRDLDVGLVRRCTRAALEAGDGSRLRT